MGEDGRGAGRGRKVLGKQEAPTTLMVPEALTSDPHPWSPSLLPNMEKGSLRI